MSTIAGDDADTVTNGMPGRTRPAGRGRQVVVEAGFVTPKAIV